MSDHTGQEKCSEGHSHYASCCVEENIGRYGGQSQEQEHVEQVMPIFVNFVLKPGQLFRELSFHGVSTELARDAIREAGASDRTRVHYAEAEVGAKDRPGQNCQHS